MKANLCSLFAFVVMLAPSPAMGAAITIESFAVEPLELPPSGTFEVKAAATAEGVDVVSAVLRTAEPIAQDKAPPALSHYMPAKQRAYLPDDGQVNLRDNGPLDHNPERNAFALRVSTDGWRPGRYVLAFFVHNRPAPGPHIKDQRNFVVEVDEAKVRITYVDVKKAPRIVRCAMEPAVVRPGETAALHVGTEGDPLTGVTVDHQYYLPPERVPPGLVYDAKRKTAWLEDGGERILRDNGPCDQDPDAGRMTVPLDTSGWKPGLYHFAVFAKGGDGLTSPQYDVAFKVRAPEDHLEVTVWPSWRVCEGTHAERIAPLQDGALVYTSHYSTDRGRTWVKRETGTIGSGAQQLRDGRVLGMAYRSLPIEGETGWYEGQRYVSTDNGRTVEGPIPTRFHVPQAKPAMGHAYHPGPLFMRSIIERPDGALVALMAGWFKGDDAPCPHNPKRPYSRTYACESRDGGATWSFLSSIGYGHIGSEGYNEGSLKVLPDGRLMAVLRTGSMSDKNCQDNPIMVSTSDDGGKTWSTPRRTGVHGAFPDLLVLSDGALAISYGRPGASIVFSTDGGETWTDRTVVDATKYSGYTTITETGPGEILLLFGAKGWRDPLAAKTRNDVRATTIRYQPAKDGLQTRLEKRGVDATDLRYGYLDCRFPSKALSKQERFVVRVPQGYRDKDVPAYPLLVFLHGAGRHCRTLVDDAVTRQALDAFPGVVVLPSGRGSWWLDSPVQPASAYATHVEEVVALVDETLHVSKESSRRAIGGWSMGGFGSLRFLVDHPAGFGAWVGILALADFPNAGYPQEDNHCVPDVFGSEERWEAINPMGGAEQLRGKSVFFLTGEEAFDRKMNETLSKKLTDLGIDHRFDTLPGGHTFDVVQAALPKVVQFLAERLE